MKPTNMIYNEVHKQIKGLKLSDKVAKDHADNAVTDYLQHKRGAGKTGWINNIIAYNVKQAKLVGKKVTTK